MTSLIPLCFDCRWFNQKDYSCKAFPGGIPNDVLVMEFYHTTKHPDQKNNIVFEPIKPDKE